MSKNSGCVIVVMCDDPAVAAATADVIKQALEQKRVRVHQGKHLLAEGYSMTLASEAYLDILEVKVPSA